MHRPHYISSTYVKLLVQANRHLISPIEHALGTPLKTLFNEPFIQGRNVERLIELFHEHGLDSWVLRHGEQLGVSSHGPLGFAVLTAPDLESAIKVVEDYSIIRMSYYDCQFRQHKKRIEFVFQTQTGSPLTNRWMVESGVHVVKQLIETIVAHPLGNNATVDFAYPEPKYKTELERFYGIECNFNQAENYISIPSSWGQISSPLSDPATFRSNLRKCQELKQQLIGESEIIESVRLALRNYFEQQGMRNQELTQLPSLSSLARNKHMTVRTFARRLTEHDYSYRKLVEEARQEHACHLLKNTHLNIADISSQLGYIEPANFIRAFKSWLSCTPTQWRKRNPF